MELPIDLWCRAALVTWPSLAKRMGRARIGRGSGDDGVAFVRGLGADKVWMDIRKDVLVGRAPVRTQRS